MNVEQLKELYPRTAEENDEENDSYYFWPPYDYDPMVHHLGDIIASGSSGDYQGDYLYVLKNRKDGRFGFLLVGYGSCSGCDALQGCDSWEDVLKLYEYIANGVTWYNSADDLLESFDEKDDNRFFSWYDDEDRDAFILQVKEALGKEVTV